MGSDPLRSIGLWRAQEGALESGVPLAVVGACWYYAHDLLSTSASGSPYTPVELLAVLGCCVAITGWTTGRQLVIYGRRKPQMSAVFGAAIGLGALFTLRQLVISGFEDACAGEWAGALVNLPALDGSAVVQVACRVGGVPDNPYLPGTFVVPAWSGALSLWHWLAFAVTGALSAIGLRDRRLRRSNVVSKLAGAYRLAPAVGLDSAVVDPKPKDGRVQACGNLTLWGEICGQIYDAEKVFEPGEWCARCHQVYQPMDRTLTLSVVSLYTADIDVLNGLERLDNVSWDPDMVRPQDNRVSGQERWIALGRIALPDGLSVATALSLVHDRLAGWASEGSPAAKEAAALATERASRIAAWIWFGKVVDRMTYARPTPRVTLAIGPARLRDLVPDTGEDLTLQLDIGLLPLELRTAFRMTFLKEGRAPAREDTKTDLWIPTALPAAAAEPGAWIPRMEGEALRAWLATERVHQASVRGVSSPLPYRSEEEGWGAEWGSRATLDFVRMATRAAGPPPSAGGPRADDWIEPDGARVPGDSIAEWAWLEGDQLQLLRQQVLVLTKFPTERTRTYTVVCPNSAGGDGLVELGRVTLCAELRVETALELVRERLGAWSGAAETPTERTALLAKTRARRDAAWRAPDRGGAHGPGSAGAGVRAPPGRGTRGGRAPGPGAGAQGDLPCG